MSFLLIRSWFAKKSKYTFLSSTLLFGHVLLLWYVFSSDPIFNNVALVPHQANFQDVPFVLELAGHYSCSSTMQVCPQTGFPVGPVPALRAGRPTMGQALLPLSCASYYHEQLCKKTKLIWNADSFPLQTLKYTGILKNTVDFHLGFPYREKFSLKWMFAKFFSLDLVSVA